MFLRNLPRTNLFMRRLRDSLTLDRTRVNGQLLFSLTITETTDKPVVYLVRLNTMETTRANRVVTRMTTDTKETTKDSEMTIMTTEMDHTLGETTAKTMLKLMDTAVHMTFNRRSHVIFQPTSRTTQTTNVNREGRMYAPREDIQHSHSLEQAGRAGDVVHEQYDIYGRPRQSSQGRRPQVTEDYQDYDYEDDYDRNSQDGIGYPSYDEYEEDYPSSPTINTSRRRHPQEQDGLRHNGRPGNGRHGNDHHGNPRRNGHRNVDPTNDDYDYDFFNDYQDDKSDSFADETNSEKNKQLGGNSLASKAPETPTGPQKFTPGVIQNGFIPITKTPHRINKRSLFHPTPKEDLSDVVLLAEDQSDGEVQRLAENNAQHSYSRISDEDFSTNIEDAFLRSVTSGDLVASVGPATSEGSVTSDEARTSEKPVTSGDPVTSDDLQPAESRHLPAYQPYYSNYERQQGRQNVEREQDPYERYLPREDDNDPYFR
ncbi:uncharacterized protein LOC122373326 [Amphibalanus amphitrite]|uniref:uncharacterized protein LOC122373326 n=1 Tax=Amphibalanus amphitrite TaxID=1232801 RepID=UPI001C9055B5|nr:uncharacterized protein LOC122373326 [Amphibalanus amphitrite]